MIPVDWTSQLAAAIAATLREYRQALQHTPVAVFHVGCYPWHGTIELSLLSAEELAADPLLSAPEEVAAWQHYDFATGLAPWEATAPLKRQMMDSYAAASPTERPTVVEGYVRACAAAVALPEVAVALSSLNRSDDFRISVTHPDTNREFYLSERAVDG